MRRMTFVLVISLFPWSCIAQAQSIAQRVTQLTQDVKTLKDRPADGSPISVKNASGIKQVVIDSDADGGRLVLSDKNGKNAGILGTDSTGMGGGIWLYTSSVPVTLVATLGTFSDGKSGALSLVGPAAGVIINGAARDYAEVFDLADRGGIREGSVVAQSASGNGLVLAAGAYNPAVVGVIAGAGDLHSGMVIGSRDDGSADLPVALAGQVFVRVCPEAGPIVVGDLLVSSSTPGVAMRGADPQRLAGTVIGKALRPYGSSGEGLIRMLVINR